MRRFKKITSMIVAIAMLFSCITITTSIYVSAADTATWQKEAIISPGAGKLVGAGYIDVKWSNTLSNVIEYKVFVDGSLKQTVSPSGETMSVEFYTTDVKAHTAQIEAVLNSGGSVKTDTRVFYVTKKGVCVNEKDMGKIVDPASMNIGWYYNWGYKSFKDMKFSNKKFYDTEFVAMTWGDNTVDIATRCAYANKKGYKYLLSYNEPDLQWEANKQPGTMVYRWRDTIDNKGNLRLGSPATETFQINSDKWWTPFWNGLNSNDKNNMSFIAVHAYQHYYDNADTALQYLHVIDEIYEAYKKPIWVTEFAVADSGNVFSPSNSKYVAQVQEFMKIVLKGLQERSYVERYAWFDFNPRDNQTGASGIFDYETGNLTTLGQIYANIGNPAGYNAKTYNISSSISKDTSVGACIAAIDTLMYTPIKKKKAFKYSFKTVKRAAGYQLQYSLNKKFKKKKKYKTKIKNIKAKNVAAQSGTIKKLKRKKRYYVRVRAYKVIGGKKYYCKWSKTRSVKTKK